MITVAPTPAARLALMREQFDRLFAAINDRMDRLAVAGDEVRDEERAVCATLTCIAHMVDQSDHEPDDVATDTLGACIAIIQSELPIRLRALAATIRDQHTAADAREWAADLEALAESDSVPA